MSAKVSRRPRLTTQPQAKREIWLDVLDWRVTPANSAKSRDVSLNQWAWGVPAAQYRISKSVGRVCGVAHKNCCR